MNALQKLLDTIERQIFSLNMIDYPTQKTRDAISLWEAFRDMVNVTIKEAEKEMGEK